MKQARPRSELNIYASFPPHLPPHSKDISINIAYFTSLRDTYCTFKTEHAGNGIHQLVYNANVSGTPRRTERAFEEMPLSVVS